MDWNDINIYIIDEYLVKKFDITEKAINRYWKNTLRLPDLDRSSKDIPILIFNYKDINFHLILDEIKKNLNLFPVGYKKVLIQGEPFLITYDLDSSILKNSCSVEFSNPFIKEVRKALAFQWLVNMTTVKSTGILVRKLWEFQEADYPVSYNEKYSMRSKITDVPTSVIKNWFGGNFHLFYVILDNILRDINPNELRTRIEDIIKKIDSSYICLVNIIYEKSIMVKKLMKDEEYINLREQYKRNPYIYIC